jgi:hypothetical protein
VNDNPEFVEVRERAAREAVDFFEQSLPPRVTGTMRAMRRPERPKP